MTANDEDDSKPDDAETVEFWKEFERLTRPPVSDDRRQPASSLKFRSDEGAYRQATSWALGEEKDIAPLMAFVRSDRFPRLLSSSPAYRESHARLIELLYARGASRRDGRPGGKHLLWQKPEYVCAFIVDKRMAAWRRKHGKRGVPAEQKQAFVDEVADEMRGWAMMRDVPVKKERVLELLRGSKNLRL